MKTNNKYLIIGAVILIIGLIIVGFQNQPDNFGKTATTTPEIISESNSSNNGAGSAIKSPSKPSGGNDHTTYKNIAYVIEGRVIPLIEGLSVLPTSADSTSKTTTRYFGNNAIGDLNRDGLSDIAFILTQDSGGTGKFYYAVVALKTETGYFGTNGVFLGDRIAPQSNEIRGGELIVNYATRLPGEPMTAPPSSGVSKRLKVLDGQLVVAAN